MTPEVKVFVAALRAGKNSGEAFVEYCWAKSAVQIDDRFMRKFGDPMSCPPLWGVSMAEAMGSEAFDGGRPDEEVSAEFERGLRIDRERGYFWRAMKPEERPSAGDLVRAMDSGERELAAEILGVGTVARMLVSR
jgi:hypothetical protein